MIEEKNSLLGYLLCSPEEENKVFCKEMDEHRKVSEYTFSDMLKASANLGEYLKDNGDWGNNIPLFLETSYDFLRTFFGVLAAKLICVPVHIISNEE